MLSDVNKDSVTNRSLKENVFRTFSRNDSQNVSNFISNFYLRNKIPFEIWFIRHIQGLIYL